MIAFAIAPTAISPEVAAALAWGSIILWIGVALPFFITSVVVHFWTRRLYKRALAAGNGKVIAARRRYRASVWYLVGSSVALGIGLYSGWVALTFPLPPPDTRVAGAVTRVGICVILISFLMTKIENLLTFTDFDSETQERIRDTNERVIEIQQRGLADQPDERSDRAEGHEHRHPENPES